MPFDPAELLDHYARHGRDFAAANAKDYERLAEQFMARPSVTHLLECKRTQGDFVRYDTVTMEFAVRTNTGILRTYFKPVPCSSIPSGMPRTGCHKYTDNIEYFKKTCLKP
jgi:pyocin large subunit-like protein